LNTSRILWTATAWALATMAARAQTNVLVSRTYMGGVPPPPGNNSSAAQGCLSDDGRIVYFTTDAQLVPGDVNALWDVHRRDLWLGTTEIVSLGLGGSPADANSNFATSSADGSVVSFCSLASNLVPGDTNQTYDCFVLDRAVGTIERVSVDSLGQQGDGSSYGESSLSADGRFVAFRSEATNLVPGDTNSEVDAFVRDRWTGTTVCVSVSAAGTIAAQGGGEPYLSRDGRFVAFFSLSSDIVPGDTNGMTDVFLRDLTAGTTVRVSVDSSGAQADEGSVGARPSADGRFVAFQSWATNLVPGDTNGQSDIFLHDRTTGMTERVSVSWLGEQANGFSWNPHVSADGRLVGFTSSATNLAPIGHVYFDAFVRDRSLQTTERVNVSWKGQTLDDHTQLHAMSPDGRLIVFGTRASDVIPWMQFGVGRVYLRDRWGCTPTRYCTAKLNSAGCTPRIGSRGQPSASAGRGFLVGADQVLPGRVGILFYGFLGPNAAPFLGGTLCVGQPLHRASLQVSSTAGAPPCTGTYGYDFNHRIASGVDPSLTLGRRVWAQFWMRDAASPSGTGSTDALDFVIGR
jgi:Tol biopolymer transport system component